MSISASGFRKSVSLVLAIFVVLNLFTWSAQARQTQGAVRIIAKDESGVAVASARVDLKLKGAVVQTATTNDKGEAGFAGLAAGTYEVTVTKAEFEARTQSDIVVKAGLPVAVEFALPKKVALSESVNMQGSNGTAIEQVSSPSSELPRATGKDVPTY